MKARQLILVLCSCMLASAAQAQLRLPRLGVPSLPAFPAMAQQAPAAVVQDLRETLVRELLQRHPEAVERDPRGEPVRRGELLWLSPSPAALEAARREGFTVLREAALPELDVHELVLRPPEGAALAAGLDRLRALDPAAQADFNPIYTPGGESEAPAGAAGAASGQVLRIGLIDAGVDSLHPDLRPTRVVRNGCGGRTVASAHGTAIASLLQASTLYAADVYCGEPAGGAAEDVARAMAWMVREQVPVVNVSLVGPPNRLLEQACAALVRKGHLIVAAVGNEGPAAPPLYPASYPGVVGVTGVLRNRHVLPEAAQGPQVMFAAAGAEVPVAVPGGGHALARGTSYAVPRVARLLARQLEAPDPHRARAALAELAARAIDLGDAGRDPVYGFGLVGAAD